MNNLAELNLKVDVIIFGEIIEHLENLKIALENMKQVMHEDTELIITTPNLFYLHNTVQIFLKNHELVHHDHKVGFTYGIINQLLNANGLEISDFYFTFLPRLKEKLDKKIIRFLCHFRPAYSENLCVIAKLKNELVENKI
jgi:2-polyprenyl-3-methyl-5-hydroxy-6-metoxy-1,4-benzoquinol methylase